MTSYYYTELTSPTTHAVDTFTSYFNETFPPKVTYTVKAESVSSNLHIPGKLSHNVDDIFAAKPTGYLAHDWSSLPTTPVRMSHHTDFDTYKSSSDFQSSVGGLIFAQNDLKNTLDKFNITIDGISNHPSALNISEDKYISNIGSMADMTPKPDLNTSISNSLYSEYRTEIQDTIKIFDFLSKIKATDHSKMNELFLLAAQYSHARSFSGSQQGIYLALSFSFYERLLLTDTGFSSVLQKVFDKPNQALIGENKPAYRKLLSKLREFILERDMNKGKVLYQSICYDAGVYEASLILFREILLENLKSYSALITSSFQDIDSSTFRWMNDIKLSEGQFYQEIAEIVKASVKVFTISGTELEQYSFPYLSLTGKTNPELVILHDKRDNACYVLYLSKEQIKSNVTETRSPPKHHHGEDKRRGSLTPANHATSFESLWDISPVHREQNFSKDSLLYDSNYNTKPDDLYGFKGSTTLLDAIINPKSASPTKKLSGDITNVYYDTSLTASPSAAATKSLGFTNAIGDGISPFGHVNTTTANFNETYRDKTVTSLVDQLIYKPGSTEKIESSLGSLTVERYSVPEVTAANVDNLLKKASLKPTIEDLLSGKVTSLTTEEHVATPIGNTGFIFEQTFGDMTPTAQQLMSSVDYILKDKLTSPRADPFSPKVVIYEKIISGENLTQQIDLLASKRNSSLGNKSSSGTGSHKGSDNYIDLYLPSDPTVKVTHATDIISTPKTGNKIDFLTISLPDNVGTPVGTPKGDIATLLAYNPLVDQILRGETPKSDSPTRGFGYQRSFPKALKEQFKVYGAEAESHEAEFNNITSKFVKNEPVVVVPYKLAKIAMKYNNIVNSKKKY